VEGPHPRRSAAGDAGRRERSRVPGGGFGSYEFYAFRADDGALAWRYQTEDDGPTAAVVTEDRVVFNTESCELEVLTEAGERVWKLWLGDPLLSMPAVADGRVFIAFPDTRGDRRHYLASFALHDGRELWRHPIAGELITCPVLADGHVYATCLDGTLSCFEQTSGTLFWTEQKDATSSAAVWQGRCYFSQRGEEERRTPSGVGRQRTERIARKQSAVGSTTESYDATTCDADYLDYGKRMARSPMVGSQQAYDTSVGFGTHQGDMKAHQSIHNLGTGHVSAIWAY
jgi:Ca-activated chloride channel family protein